MPVLQGQRRPRPWVRTLFNPFVLDKPNTDGREGMLLVSIANWQRCCGALLVILLVVSGITWRLSGKPETVTHLWVIEVAETGQIRTVGLVPQEPWRKMTNPMVEWVVKYWLFHTRTVGDSEILLGQGWSKALAFTAPKVQPWLREQLKERWALRKQNKTVQIGQVEVLPIAQAKHAYKASWVESTMQVSGEVDTRRQWEATLTVGVYPPGQLKDKDVKEDTRTWRNELGIQIEEAHWLELAPLKKGQ